MKNLSERIVEVLKKSNRVSDADIQKALEVFSKEGGKLTDVFVRMGMMTEKEIVSLIGDELNMPFLNLTKYKIDPEIGKIIPEKLARKYQIVPISKIGNTLTLAISDPFNILAIDDIATFTRRKIDCVISTEKFIREALDRLYSVKKETLEEASGLGLGSDTIQFDSSELDAEAESSEAPIVKMVDTLLRESLKRRASDIHLEPFEKEVRVRYRVDGNLEESFAIPKNNQNAVLTRIKIMCKLDITENRLPQDGRFKVKLQNREIDFRVSVLPVTHGSKIVMRLLDKGSLSLGLEKLGFSPECFSVMKSAIVRPFGMILITGPTGSGKSTTLYSILNQLNSPEKNLITIEDPIEYQVKGITQIQTRPEIGFDFATGLRAILRQSPDIVMVGEIRDSETADIAVKASLTGQLVLSTLHTNDAAGAVTRMIDMGIEPFLVASGVILVAAQRLCRKICPHCKEKTEVPKEVLKRLNINLAKIAPHDETVVFYKGKGCAKCNKTGYLGRVAILESMLIDDKIRDMIVKKASSYEIKDYAVKNGMITLRDDAIRKVAQGVTTLDEVVRVTTEDE